MIQILYEYNNACSSPALSYIIDIIKSLLLTIQILGPIVLIIGLTIHITKQLTNPDNKEEPKKIKNSIIATVLLFLIPFIISFSMGLLGNSFSFSECWNAKREISGSSNYTSTDSGKRKKIINIGEGGYDKPIEEPETTPSPTRTPTPGTTTSTPTPTPPSSPGTSRTTDGTPSPSTTTPSPSSQKEVLPTEGSGKYFPALQGSNFKISGASETGGCKNSGKVIHDLNIKVGTSIYAAFDGTIEYIQYTCNGILYSYGNQARLTDPKTNTFVLYGHLSKFVGADNQVTKTCHDVYGKNAGCGADDCSSSIKKTKVLTKQVQKGELIGYIGNTGNSDGPHLHVEIHENGSSSCLTDPYKAMGMH